MNGVSVFRKNRSWRIWFNVFMCTADERKREKRTKKRLKHVPPHMKKNIVCHSIPQIAGYPE